MSTNLPVDRYVAVEQCLLCASHRRSVVYEGIEDYKYKVPGDWCFIKCIDCGAVYLDPRLADPMDGYRSGYFQHKQLQNSSQNPGWVVYLILGSLIQEGGDGVSGAERGAMGVPSTPASSPGPDREAPG